jgi:hypothetical protein
MSAGRCSNPLVSVRRAAARLSTVVVAILVALAMPVSQLRTVAFIKSCCCPDPSNCRCPDHKADPTPQPSMRACHSTERAVVAPQLTVFRAPAVEIASVLPAPMIAPAAPIPAPHPAPPLPRPDAPS